jgi:hypothetical protein
MRLRSLWAGSCTLLGFLLAGLLAVRAGGAHWQRLDGVWECTLRRPLRLPFEAIALGELVIAVDSQAMQRLRRHERVHVEQARRWGPLFLAAYPLASLWCWLRGRRPYFDNPFEEQARRLGG